MIVGHAGIRLASALQPSAVLALITWLVGIAHWRSLNIRLASASHEASIHYDLIS